MALFTVFGVLVVIMAYIVLRRAKKKPKVTLPSSAPESLSIEQAQALVEGIVAKGEKVVVEPVDGTPAFAEKLGPATRQFFARYGSLSTRRGGFRLAASEVHASEYMNGYLSIGHSEDWDVVQKPGRNEVFVIEGAESGETEMEVCFPSVYHLVLEEAQRA